jgi:hypothetical protein
MISPEDSYHLAGMETSDRDRHEARAEAEREAMEAKMREPLGSISGKAGRMERDSPLFFGTGDNPTLF